MSQIEVDSLCKSYAVGSKRTRAVVDAVKNVNLSIEAGELVGFIGPNGAGKSTTIKMLSGILMPTSGSIRVNGLVPSKQRKETARQMGVVFGQRSQLIPELPLRDSFELVRALYGVPHDVFAERLDQLVSILQMESFVDQRARSLSLGQRMRGDLVAAMLHAPGLLYLDEPTVGLDALAKGRIREFVAEANRSRGTTVILTSHDLADVEELCQRLVMIDGGTIIFDGTVDRFKRESAPYREFTAATAMPVSASSLDGLGAGVAVVSTQEYGFTLRFDPDVIGSPELISRLAQSFDLVDFTLREPPLEEIIRGLYEQRSSER